MQQSHHTQRLNEFLAGDTESRCEGFLLFFVVAGHQCRQTTVCQRNEFIIRKRSTLFQNV